MQVELKLYQLDELSYEARQRAIDALSDINVSFGDWWDFIEADFLVQMSEAGIQSKNVFFDFDRGMYAVLHKPRIWNAEKLLDTVFGVGQLQRSWSEQQLNLDITSHRESMTVECEDAATQEKVRAWFDGKSSDFLKMLREEYEYLTGEEAVKDTIEANEFWFLENGNRWLP